MGRRLPWKTSPSSAHNKSVIKSESPRAAGSPRAPATPSASTRAALTKKPRRDRVIDADDRARTPSTSPPPEPPPERFMRSGPELDDRYRMVEDEFLSMAHQFTTHLHRAEYNRLKTLAKSQNAATIREIERPVFGTPTLLARQRQDKVQRVAKQSKVLPGGGGGGETPSAGTSLQGLMESPRKKAKWISAGMAGTAATRAAAGFGSHRSPVTVKATPKGLPSAKKRRLPPVDDDDTDEGDDLGSATPSRKPVTKSPRTAQISSPGAVRSAARTVFSTPRALTIATDNTPRMNASVKRPTTTPGKTETVHISKVTRHNVHDDDDDDDPFGISKRRIQRQQSKEQFRKVEQRPPPKKSSLDDIPSFI
ncbi:hypothetical protein FZEAL_3304 [Fusarium zealandicum]|uniref:Uncharacterized protein n=1 Tax=Fusarium zealandicum TaxID=1053134 RepID=A0A8H4UNZ2_9HYPO|nr:hypothetical protein FZEAL_3304 [Fusarium zealandicum]